MAKTNNIGVFFDHSSKDAALVLLSIFEIGLVVFTAIQFPLLSWFSLGLIGFALVFMTVGVMRVRYE